MAAVLCAVGSVATSEAAITLSSQTDSTSVQGFVQTPNFAFGSYNHGPSNNTLLGPVNYLVNDQASSGPSFVASDMSDIITGTAFGNTGLLVTGAMLGHATSHSEGAVNTTVGAFQNYQLNFSVDVPTAVFLRVTILESTPITSGSIGLLSNPNSIGWGAGPGQYIFNDVISPGVYTLNVNSNMFYSTGGTTESHVASMNFHFELGAVPTPGTLAMIGASGLATLRRRRR